MAGNSNLHAANKAKKDEFYTQLSDIANELKHYKQHFAGKTVFCNCDDPYESNFFKYFALNFNQLGLKKLIATCYNGSPVADTQMCLFEPEAPYGKQQKTRVPHKIVITEVPDTNGDGATDLADVEWLIKNDKNILTTLQGNGDFRSPECVELLKEADIVVTNPPFSLFREFLAWIVQADKKFVIIGNMNAITYKEVFPLIKENKMWLGNGFHAGNAYFKTIELTTKYAEGVYDENTGLVKFRNCCWFTNLEHGRRHQPLQLMTMADNIKFSTHKEIKGKAYQKYDNYDAIEVPFTDAIPSDYKGVMGVPISFLDKYCPEQFEIVEFRKGNDGKDLIYSTLGGASATLLQNTHPSMPIGGLMNNPKDTAVNGKSKYARILIRKLVFRE